MWAPFTNPAFRSIWLATQIKASVDADCCYQLVDGNDLEFRYLVVALMHSSSNLPAGDYRSVGSVVSRSADGSRHPLRRPQPHACQRIPLAARQRKLNPRHQRSRSAVGSHPCTNAVPTPGCRKWWKGAEDAGGHSARQQDGARDMGHA